MGQTLYSILKNPITDDAIDRIVESYENHHSMYSALTRCEVAKKVKGRYNVSDRDAFYVRIFKDWKKSITKLLNENRVAQQYRNDAILLYQYLRDKNPKAKEEVDQIMDYEKIPNETLKKALDCFRWNKIGEYSGWDHIHSNYINFGLHGKQNIRHRLYVNCDSTWTHRVMLRFIEKCNEKNLSYYFKFDDYGARDDSIVFYSDAAHVAEYIRILREIRKEDHLDSILHKPPVLTSTIDNWIGYGSEPQEEDTSFNSKRSDHIEKCIKEVSTEWMMRNLNSVFRLNGKEITYREYLRRSVVKAIKEYTLRYARDDESYKKYNGYTKRDLESREFKCLLDSYVTRNLNQIIAYLNGSCKTIDLSFPYKAGKVRISTYPLENARRSQIAFMNRNSKRFKKDLKEKIRTTSPQMGIDPDNYACDIYVLRELGKEAPKTVKNLRPSKEIPTEPYKRGNAPKKGVVWSRPMTEEEINASQKKIGK